MSLLCQKESYLKEFADAAIKSIQAGKIETTGSKWINGYDVVLEDTIFFPEGGGQPYDIGTLDGHAVTNVRRDGDQAILFLPSTPAAGDNLPFEVGSKPIQAIDWSRRFDHMQQHTGQHLITALARTLFSLPTTSWCLGPESSFIELDAKEVPETVLVALEASVNEAIRQRHPVSVSYREADNLSDVRFHQAVPEAQRGSGLVRIIEIAGDIDRNSCCGTHLSNLGDLQAIKLLGVTKGKKGRSQLHFLAGGRVLNSLDASLKRERALTAALKCPPEELVLMLEKTQKSVKRLQKNVLSSLRDLAQFEGQRFLATLVDQPQFFTLHRKEGDYDFISIFINTVGDQAIQDRLLLLSVADDSLVANSGGQILLAGSEEMVKKASEIVINGFAAKGSVQRGKFRGRLPDVSKMGKLEEAIQATVLP